MAKARDIAALAGLAGLAYAYNKNKGKPNEDAGKQTTSSYTKEDKKVEAKDEPFKATHGSSYTPGNAGTARPGVGDATNDPIVKPAPAAKPVLKPAAAADESAGFATPVSSANRTDQLTNLSRAVKREDKTKNRAKSEFPNMSSRFEGNNYTTVTNARALNEKLNREAGSGTSSGYKTDAMKVASRAAAAADRQRKMAQQSSYKSGGMTSSASKRADGIASRGKTKCKMY